VCSEGNLHSHHQRRCNSAATTRARKVYLHELRQRRWLKNKGKYGCLDFTDAERSQLDENFKMLAGGNEKIPMQTMEELLMLLNVVDTVEKAQWIIKSVRADDDIGDNDGTNFEDFLKLLMKFLGTEGVLGLTSILETGRVDFHTASLAYRRKRILEGTGVHHFLNPTATSKVVQDRGALVSKRMFALQKDREINGVSSFGLPPGNLLSGNNAGNEYVPSLGNLTATWHDVCLSKNLRQLNPKHGEESNLLLRPRSPREIIESIVRTLPNAQQVHKVGQTIVVRAPRMSDFKNNDRGRAGTDPGVATAVSTPSRSALLTI
jgi:hypothetical protein